MPAANDDRNYDGLFRSFDAVSERREAAARAAGVAFGGGGPHDPGMDALIKRMDRMESVLERLEPKITEIHASMTATIPHLATKAELTALQLEIAHSERRVSDQIGNESSSLTEKLNSRPTTATIITIIGLLAALAAVPWKDFLKLFGAVTQ